MAPSRITYRRKEYLVLLDTAGDHCVKSVGPMRPDGSSRLSNVRKGSKTWNAVVFRAYETAGLLRK